MTLNALAVPSSPKSMVSMGLSLVLAIASRVAFLDLVLLWHPLGVFSETRRLLEGQPHGESLPADVLTIALNNLGRRDQT